jgi:heme oxygenase (biliverdin-IX-beta and delta-forming)
MGFGQNRRALREATSASHTELDKLVGEFRTPGEYARYLRGIEVFRRSIESGFQRDLRWTPTLVADDAARDLLDLNLAAQPALYVQPTHSTSAQLGRAYVLEGSGLGARVLVHGARKLGFDADFGARHLWRQASAQENWRALLELLERDDVAIDAAIDEAMLTFGLAHAAMSAAMQEA